MALNITTFKREFVYEKDGEKINLPDPGNHVTADKVPDFYSVQYPELINAKIEGPKLDNDNSVAVYTISVKAGTKG